MSCVEEIYNQIHSLVSPFLLLKHHGKNHADKEVYDLQLVKEYWNSDSHQAGDKRSLLALLFRATEAIPITGENKNDPRVLEIWLLYITLSEALGDKNEDELRSFFKFLKSSRVGVRNARFYSQWALFEKRKGKEEKAIAILKSGRENDAKPDYLLNESSWLESPEQQLNTEEEGLEESKSALLLVEETGSSSVSVPSSNMPPPHAKKKMGLKRLGFLGVPLRSVDYCINNQDEDEDVAVDDNLNDEDDIDDDEDDLIDEDDYEDDLIEDAVNYRDEDLNVNEDDVNYYREEEKGEQESPHDARDVEAEDIHKVALEDSIGSRPSNNPLYPPINPSVTPKFDSSSHSHLMNDSATEISADQNKENVMTISSGSRQYNSIISPNNSSNISSETSSLHILSPHNHNQNHAHTSTFPFASLLDPKAQVQINGKIYCRLKMIGKGGSSKVYSVLSPSGEIYALKRIDLEGGSGGGGETDEAVLQGYKNEIDLLKQFRGDPYVVQLIDYEITLNHIYLVMEAGEIDMGRLLAQYRSGRGRSEYRALVSFCWQSMVLAVSSIHRQKIVHCDLKPANFLLVKGAWKLIDFGISKTIMHDHTSVLRESQVGTVSYMSPEALMSSSSSTANSPSSMAMLKINRAADVWSLGCILYEMVFGKSPFSIFPSVVARLSKICDRNYTIPIPPTPPLTTTPDQSLVADYADIIRGCLERDVTKRTDLAQLVEGGGRRSSMK